jgi:23S rRNA (uracil1939-C5)-methyltransferase
MKRQNRPTRSDGRHTAAAARDVEVIEKTLEIGAIGARGDAIVEAADGPLYVPFALPGEQVRARLTGHRGEISEILSASSDRQAAVCQHFGRCGGCQLQHWRDEPYLAWKRAQVVEALARRGLGGAVVDETIPAWGAGRRRAAFHVARERGKVRVGFVERGGAALTPIAQCPVLAPELERVALTLTPLAARLLPQRGELTLQCLLTEAGVDVAVKGAGRADALSLAEREALTREVEALGLARLSIDGEPLVERKKPLLRMGRALVAPPPGAFLQPTALGEETLARLTLDALKGAERVVDLFSGIGTFALRLAEQAEVTAAESDADMLAALKKAADGAGGTLKQVTTLRRDLLRTPLSNLEMKKFDGAVIDPPRSGARLQAEQIAKAPIRKLANVSCDPASFARDLKILVDHGFQVTRITPVDQFRWSPHIEVVGALER